MSDAVAKAFGNRVRREREDRKWTLRRLEQLSGLPLARLQRIETDPQRDITAEDVLRLADSFGVPMAWLAQGSQVRARVLTAARCDNEETAEQALDAVLPIMELAVQLDDIEDRDDAGRIVPEHRRQGVPPRAWGHDAAEWLRGQWGIPSGPVLDLADVIESRSDVMVVVAPLADGVDGLALTDPETGNTLIAVAETDRWERQRFTLAHELGHLLAGDRIIEAVQYRGQSPTETAASEFARNFLVPIGDLERMHSERGRAWDAASVAEAAWRYQVSPEVFAIQLCRADLAGDSLVDGVARVSADAWSRLGGWEPQRRALTAQSSTRRVPPAILRRARDAWQAGLLPTATIARVLRADSADIEHDLGELQMKIES